RLQSRLKADRRAGIDTGTLTVDAERTNDGIVPSASQLHGELLGVFASDHLDCVGHFPRITRNGTRVSGWVRSGAGFTPERLRHLWGNIADFIAQHG
ncbi:MAG: hypothetical protein AAFS10_19595, partial [Myxococcota bacterium]